MRTGVALVAAALVAALGGMGFVTWSVLHGGSGKGKGSEVAGIADRPPVKGVAGRSGSHARPAIPAGARPNAPLPDPDPDPDPDLAPERPEAARAPTPGASGEANGAPARPAKPRPSGYDPLDPNTWAQGAAPSVTLPGTPPGDGPGPIGDGGPAACPAGMVDTGAYCIDATEVSNALYAAFLATRPSLQKQPEVCKWNTSFAAIYGAPRGDQRPVVGVDWCDAYAYCAAAGKNLCGHIGGGSNPVAAFADATESQWYAACTNGGTTRFSYGDSFDASLCFHPGDDGALAPVGSYPKCVGATPPYDQLFDMSGNAWEWEDSCSGTAGGGNLCRVRGGGAHSASAVVDCGMDYLTKRDNTSRAIGIRCCGAHLP